MKRKTQIYTSSFLYYYLWELGSSINSLGFRFLISELEGNIYFIALVRIQELIHSKFLMTSSIFLLLPLFVISNVISRAAQILADGGDVNILYNANIL